MGKKAEERERRKERNKRIIKGMPCALGLILVTDLFVYLVASLIGDTDVAAYAFLAIFLIVPPMTWAVCENLSYSPSSLEERELFGD